MLALLLLLSSAASALQARVSPPDATGMYVVQFAERFVRRDDPAWNKELDACRARFEKKKRSDCYTTGPIGGPERWLVIGDPAFYMNLDPAKGVYKYSYLPTAKDQRFASGDYPPEKLDAKRLSDLAASDAVVPAKERDFLVGLAKEAFKRAKPLK